MKIKNQGVFLKHFIVSIVFAFTSVISTTASAVFINFDTDQSGVAYTGLGDSFATDEYNGVNFNASAGGFNSIFVNLTNPLNIGTDISGYYVNIGAFDGISTQLTLDFTTDVTAVSFDFANPQGFLNVFAYDANNNLLDSTLFLRDSVFINQAGFNQRGGNVSLSGIGNISRLVIEPNPNEALIFDNLDFRPVPVPAALPLFASGLLGLAFMRRRNKQPEA